MEECNKDAPPEKGIEAAGCRVSTCETKEDCAAETNDADRIVKPSLLKRLRKYSVIEPFMFLFVFSVAIRMSINGPFAQMKSCMITNNLTLEECQALPKNGTIMKAAQAEANVYATIGAVVATLPQIFVGIFIASFCDKYGRKVPMLIAPLGMAIELAGYVVCAIFMRIPLFFLVIIHLPTGFTGGMMVAFTGIYSYLTDTCSEKERPHRFAIVEACMFIGMIAGNLFGGFCYEMLGFVAIYVSSLIGCLIAIALLYFTLHEPRKLPPDMPYREIAKQIFNFDAVRQSLRVCFRVRYGNARLQLWLIILALIFIQMPLMGSAGVLYFYSQVRYGWEVGYFTYVNTAFKFVSSLLCPLIIRLLTKYLSFHDMIISLIGLSFAFSEQMVRGLSVNAALFFISYAVGTLSNLSGPTLRSRLTKVVPSDEIGKVLIVQSIGETLTMMVGASLFNLVYNETMLRGFPGIVFILAAILLLIPFAIALFVLIAGTSPEKIQAAENDCKPKIDLPIGVTSFDAELLDQTVRRESLAINTL